MFPSLSSKCVVLFCLCVLFSLVCTVKTDGGPITIEEHIQQMGYPVETHHIQTEDGYILTYHRIPYGRLHSSKIGPPVLVQHGLFALSRVWAVVNDSLGFVLADAGYDVWLANARGTFYSRIHVRYDPDVDKELFWDFSWHEMGHYDIPAGIDYILNITRHSQLSFVGHSMGTTMYFVFSTTRPEYLSKVRVAALMAPVAYIKDMRSIFNAVYELKVPLQALVKIFGIYEFLPYNQAYYWLIHLVCGSSKTQFLCRDLIGSICGFDNAEFSSELLPTYIDFLPGGTSTKTMIHFGQIINGEFKQYDYGLLGNLKKYNSLVPPLYNLENSKAPVYFFLAANDWIVSPSIATYTAQKMPNLQGLKLVDDVYFNHADFMWATDVKTLVYNDVVEAINKYK